MERDKQDFQQFMKQRDEASKAFTNGEAGPLGRIVTHALPATFFGPDGSVQKGAEEVYAVYQRSATLFQSGDFRLETLQQSADDSIAYWVGLQQGTAKMRDGKEVPFNLRITEIYRLENQEWKLIHRHADALTSNP